MARKSPRLSMVSGVLEMKQKGPKEKVFLASYNTGDHVLFNIVKEINDTAPLPSLVCWNRCQQYIKLRMGMLGLETWLRCLSRGSEFGSQYLHQAVHNSTSMGSSAPISVLPGHLYIHDLHTYINNVTMFKRYPNRCKRTNERIKHLMNKVSLSIYSNPKYRLDLGK